MSVHAQLRRLVSQHGQSVLHSSEDLRGLLDDYFSEDEITVGEVNLLVDAVRMNAFDRLGALLAQGADPRVAVEAAGRALAEERSGDPRTAAWACAALGYAVGSIPEAIVLAYGSGPPRTSPSGQGQPVAPPPVPPQQPPEPPTVVQAAVPAALPPPPWQRTSGPAPQQRAAQPPPPQQRAAQPPPPWPVPSAPERRSRGGWLVAGVVAVAAMIVALLVVIVDSGGDDGSEADPGATGGTAGDSSDSGATEETVGTRPPGTEVPLAELAQNYASLGSTLAADAESCETLEPRAGTVERLRCTYEHLPVIYTTYVDLAALEADRESRLEALPGRVDATTESHVTEQGAYVLHQGETNTSLYWDATADLQSGHVKAPVEQLFANAAKNWFDQRGEAAATRMLPAAVAPFQSQALWAHARDFVGDQVSGENVQGCESRPNLQVDFPQLDRVECFDGDFRLVFVEVPEDLSAAREHFRESAETYKTWNWFGADGEVDYPTAGVLMRTETAAGETVLYWDDTAQNVYGFIVAPDGDYSRAEAYWQTADASSS